MILLICLVWGRSLRLGGWDPVVVLTEIMDFFSVNKKVVKSELSKVCLPCLELVTSAKQDPSFEASTASGVKSKCSWTATAATENLYQFLQVKIFSANIYELISVLQTIRGAFPNTPWDAKYISINWIQTYVDGKLPEI